MCGGSPTAGTWSSSQWRPDDGFETDRRRLPESCATSRVQLLPQALVLPPQAIAFPLQLGTFGVDPRPLRLRPVAILTQAPDLIPELVDDLVRGARRRVGHAPVMPEFSRRYKSDPVINYMRTLPSPCPLDATSRGKDTQSAAQGESEIGRFVLSGMRGPATARNERQRAANAVCSAC